MKQLYVDALVFSSEALSHLVSVLGANRIVMGTDYPYPWTATPDDARLARFDVVAHVLGHAGAERRRPRRHPGGQRRRPVRRFALMGGWR